MNKPDTQIKDVNSETKHVNKHVKSQEPKHNHVCSKDGKYSSMADCTLVVPSTDGMEWEKEYWNVWNNSTNVDMKRHDRVKTFIKSLLEAEKQKAYNEGYIKGRIARKRDKELFEKQKYVEEIGKLELDEELQDFTHFRQGFELAIDKAIELLNKK